LVHHLARAGGRDAALAGNIGTPALDLLDRAPPELVVLELSSYQIADLRSGPEVAVVTSLFREHAEWHGSEQAYRSDKLNLLELPQVRAAVVNGRVPELVEAAERGGGETVLFGVPGGWDADASGIRRAGELEIPAGALPLPGEHNALNLCAALACLAAIGGGVPLPEALAGFRPLPHRLEAVREDGDLAWIDDSISTTPESTLAALEAFANRDVVLLAGGQDRGQDYTGLAEALARRGAAVVGMPTTGGRIVGAARAAGLPAERAFDAGDLESAVERAIELAVPGGVILLSPAAPSYDRFRNFEERGDRFRDLAGQADAPAR
jgi:UDP-N-acetylmuramoyl-L-alanine---L-glutamate ligase